MVNLSTPPMVAGKSAEELVSVRRYLFRLVEELNMSLNSLTVENFTPAAAKELGGVPSQSRRSRRSARRRTS